MTAEGKGLAAAIFLSGLFWSAVIAAVAIWWWR
jgi:hypothetical protein